MYVNEPIRRSCIILLLICSMGWAVAQPDTTVKAKVRRHSLVVYAGGGITQYTAAVGTTGLGPVTDVGRLTASGTLRLMWHPDHRLRVGLETGYTGFYSYRLQKPDSTGSVDLNAIPIMLVWSMPVAKRFEVFSGIGSYILYSKLHYFGKVNSTTSSLGLLLAACYKQPITDRWKIAAEVKWMNAFQTKDQAFSLQLQLIYKTLEW